MASSLSAADDIYVSAERGNDATGDGTEANPYKTIQRGVDEADDGYTVKILRGIYDTGEYWDGNHTNRVVIGKSITLEGVEGKEVTHVVGYLDPNSANGNSPSAIRCIAITNSAAGNTTVIKNLTLRNGGADSENKLWGYGGAIRYLETRSSVCLVDCVISNCVAVMGGGLSGVTAVRCKINNCKSTGFGSAARYCNLLNCLVSRSWNVGSENRPAIAYSTAVNCTIALGQGSKSQGIGRDSYAYNCISFGNGNSADIVTGTYKALGTNCCYTTSDSSRLLFSTATDDFRLTAGTAAVGGGKTSYLTSKFTLPTGVAANIDFAGNEIDLSKATCDAGCFQGAVTPASGRIEFAGAGGWVVNGVVNETVGSYAYYTPEAWPVTVMARPRGATAAKPFLLGTLEGWTQKTGTYRWPTMDGVLPLVPPPTVGENMKVTPQFADAVVWADDDGDAATANGTEAHPFPVLQDAIGYATNTYSSSQKILVLVKPGIYDRGETLFSGVQTQNGSSDGTFCKTRLVIPNRPAFVVRSTQGAAVTTIKGAADNTGPHPSNYVGCGPNSVRCVAFDYDGGDSKYRRALQGFTLADGHSACNQYNQDKMSDRGGAVLGYNDIEYNFVADCVITNCTSVRATIYGVWAARCKFYACEGYGGVMRYAILSGCFVDSSCQLGTAPSGASRNAVLGNATATYLSTLPNASMWYGRSYYNTLFGNAALSTSDTMYGSVATNEFNLAGYSGTVGIAHVDELCCVDPENGDWRLYGLTPVRHSAFLPDRGTAAYGLWATNFAAYVTTGLSGEVLSVTDGVPLAGCHQQVVREDRSIYVSAVKGGLSVEGASASGYSIVAEDGEFTITRTSATRPCIGYAVNGVTNLFDETPSRTFTAADVATEEYGMLIQALYTSDWYVSPSGNDGDYGDTPNTPFRTLAYAMTKAVGGDTVHAAEGIYSDGSATQSSDPGYDHASRVIVTGGVTLVADGAVENTIILGAADTSASGNAYGQGPNALRCVTLLDNATIKGFTITGGRTRSRSDNPIEAGISDLEWNSFGNWSGGGVQGSKDNGREKAFVVDCVISNCYAVFGGGAALVNLVRCKVLDCHAPSGNGGGADLVNMYGSLIDMCTSSGGGAALSDFSRIYNSTIGPHCYDLGTTTPRAAIATGSSGIACLVNCLVLGQTGGKGSLTNLASYTVFANSSNGFPTDETTVVVPSSELAVDDDLRPIPFRNAAIGAGSEALLTDFSATDGSAKRFLPYASDYDLSGMKRITNGSLDSGALEADWRPQYARTLGGAQTKVVLTEADSNVVDDGSGEIMIPDGASVSLTWGSPSLRGDREGVIRVSGTGVLTMYVAGEVYATVSASDGAYAFNLKPELYSSLDLDFSFEGDGAAYLSRFKRLCGFVLSFR